MPEKRPPKRPEAKKAPKAKAKAAADRPDRAAASGTGPLSEQLGPRLRAELEQIEKSEAKILRGLSNKATAEQFLRDPAGALRKMKVDVPPIMASRLKDPTRLADFVAPRRYQLPNGQVVTARVKVRFTAGKPGSRDGEEG